MNYTELIDRFWRLDQESQFTPAETRTYLILLDTFSRVGLDRTVTMSNALAVGLLGISLNAYRRVRQSLIDRGLIAVEFRTVQRRRCAVISLADPYAKPQPEQEPETQPKPEPKPEPQPEQPAVPVQSAQPDAPASAPISVPQYIKVKAGAKRKIKVVRIAKGNGTRRCRHPRYRPYTSPSRF